eukprot:4126060-Prymnesium_polylepis.1
MAGKLDSNVVPRRRRRSSRRGRGRRRAGRRSASCQSRRGQSVVERASLALTLTPSVGHAHRSTAT